MLHIGDGVGPVVPGAKGVALEAMQAILAQVDRVNPQVNAIVTLARESALAEARAATRALSRRAELPPLFGVPVVIKDLTATKGLRTTYGSKIYADHVPTEDALVVRRLKAPAPSSLGKTNTPEFGAGANTFNAVFGATRNPWNLALTCGGSSGGSAVALATGMGPLAHGTDLGGSLASRRRSAGSSVSGRRRAWCPSIRASWPGITSRCTGRWRARWRTRP